jgi:hypothetical protein
MPGFSISSSYLLTGGYPFFSSIKMFDLTKYSKGRLDVPRLKFTIGIGYFVDS